jgi:hypothetical protein
MIVFSAAAIMSVLGAVASLMRGKPFVFDESPTSVPDKKVVGVERTPAHGELYSVHAAL